MPMSFRGQGGPIQNMIPQSDQLSYQGLGLLPALMRSLQQQPIPGAMQPPQQQEQQPQMPPQMQQPMPQGGIPGMLNPSYMAPRLTTANMVGNQLMGAAPRFGSR